VLKEWVSPLKNSISRKAKFSGLLSNPRHVGSKVFHAARGPDLHTPAIVHDAANVGADFAGSIPPDLAGLVAEVVLHAQSVPDFVSQDLVQVFTS